MAKQKLSALERSYRLKCNGDLFRSYMSFRQKTIDSVSLNEYMIIIIKFLETVELDIENITIPKIKDYLKKLSVSDNRRNTIIGRIADFFRYAQENNFKIDFEISDIEKMTIKNADKKPRNPPKALSIKNIIDIRNKLLSEPSNQTYLRYLLTFELAYTYGLTLEELSKCNSKNIDSLYTYFKLQGRKIILTPKIKSIITKNPKIIENQYADHNAIQTHFKKIGELIGRDLKWLDIKETRRKYSLRCTFCEHTYPNEAEYWAIIKEPTDQTGSLWIICRDCAKKLGAKNSV